MIRSLIPVTLLSLLFFSSFAQPAYLPFEQVRRYTRTQPPNRYDSVLKFLTNRLGAEMHYLYPLYQAIGRENKFKAAMGEKGFYARFGQLLSFAGDYSTAVNETVKSFDTLSAAQIQAIADTVKKIRDIQYTPAKEAIINNARHYQVIMINESAAKPVHRAFTYSLLEDLYKEGFRYLALDGLNNFSNKCLDSLNVFTGYNMSEPIAGELVRKALRLGYTLVSYEDTLAPDHTISQRDSVQAVHLWEFLQKDVSAKILVHAGYRHINEEKTREYAPMGWWFRKLSGIDPFTIDQTGMSEGSEFEYGRLFYEYFNTQFTITEPSVLFRNKRAFNPLEEKGYDVIIMHPATRYLHNRPDWLSLGGERKPVLIQPTEKLLFYVQAYYENEYDPETISFRVPADQTYTANREGYYCLYLRKGKYRIILRDIGYKILSTKTIEVN